MVKDKCKFWETCYRKDPTHKKNFLHPGDKVEKDEEEDMEVEDSSSKPVPLRRRKTHELSQSDGEEDEDVTPQKTLKKSDSKKAKSSEDEEKPGPSGGSNSSDEDTSKPKPKCEYWIKCYRKDPKHLKDYRHPKQRISSRPKPTRKLEDGDIVSVEGGFKLKRIGSDFTCTCIGWKTQKNATNKRTCKHLREHLGDVYESARIGQLPVAKRKAPEPTQHFKHLNVSLLLAHKYDEKATNPVGWWVSEKLDGVRAFWNGKCFYSRLGNPFYAPKWFTKDLPKDMHLDGELFGGRKKFQSTVSIVKTPECDNWKKIIYSVFDAPHMEKETFEKRQEALQEYFDENEPQYAELVKQSKCTSKQQLDEDLKKIIALGGEGLMIREPKSKYERRRSKTLLKLKKFYDAEAVVIGYDPGKGRFTGAVGALRCKMECGKIFSVGSGLTDKDHRRPPKIGSIITYKFQEYTNSGSPRFPTFLGVRIDATKPKDAEVPVTAADE